MTAKTCKNDLVVVQGYDNNDASASSAAKVSAEVGKSAAITSGQCTACVADQIAGTAVIADGKACHCFNKGTGIICGSTSAQSGTKCKKTKGTLGEEKADDVWACDEAKKPESSAVGVAFTGTLAVLFVK